MPTVPSDYATGKSGFAHSSIRPLVRYVDEEQAVIDIGFTLCPDEHAVQRPDTQFEVDLELAADEQTYKRHTVLKLADQRPGQCDSQQTGMVRFTVNRPQRWWPAGLGEQVLYQLTVKLIVDDHQVETWTHTLGLTSVRASGENAADHSHLMLLVNGRACDIREIIAIGPDDESELIPVCATSLLVVRGHFGPPQLYDAADRAGILLIQAIPTAHTDGPASTTYLASEIDRLASHPSLAGWLIGQHTPIADRVTRRVRQMDPTRRVFRDMPVAC